MAIRSNFKKRMRACKFVKVVSCFMYEVTCGKPNEFEFKFNVIKDGKFAHLFKHEYERRQRIREGLNQTLSNHALQFHLRPTSLRVWHVSKHFGQDLLDRRYWE